MRRLVRTVLLCAGLAAPLLLSAQTSAELREDADTAWRTAAARYAYFDAKATAWAQLPRFYADELARLSTRDELVRLLEHSLDELYDPHAQLNVNLATSYRLVPSGADLWAQWRSGQAVVTDVRDGSDAQKAGIRPNDVVLRIDDTPIAAAVDARLGRSYPRTLPEARDWALRSVLAGRHGVARRLQLRRAGAVLEVALAAPDQVADRSRALVSHRHIAGGIGHLRLIDSLGDAATIEAVDRALDALVDTRALIVDLRDTPGGGNSVVARGILGRFVDRERPYQRHLLPEEERDTGVRRSWLELVSPRGARVRQPVVVLVGHWTGSMGEGLAIGFDATGSGTVVGTAMAGLLGATDRIVLPHTGIAMNLPTERLTHVDGRPRETFLPTVIVDVTRAGPDADPVLTAAVRLLSKRRAPPPALRRPPSRPAG